MGSTPSAATVVMPSPAKSTMYAVKEPQEAYIALAGYGKRLYDQTQVATANLQAQSGTPQQLGQRQLDQQALTAAAYSSSLPKAASADLKQTAADLLQKAKERAAAGPGPSAETPAYVPPSWVYGPSDASMS